MENTAENQGIVYNSPTIRSWRDEGHFVIPDVVYRGESTTYRLFEQMTPSMTQDVLSELYDTEKQAGNPHPTDMPLAWAIATRSYELRNKSLDSEGLRQFFRKGFRSYPNTLTRVIYSPSGNYRIVHNHGTSDEYSIDAEVVGQNDWITELSDTNVLEHLLGTKDVTNINRVSQWVNETNSYLWRLNSKPRERDERVAGFDANGDRLDLFCNRSPLIEYPAFRVLKAD